MEALSWRTRGRLWLRLGLRAALVIGGLLLLFQLILPATSFLMPFVLGLVVAWIFNRPIRFFQKKLGAPRKVLSLVFLLFSFALLGGILVAFAYAMVSQLRSFLQNWESLWSGAMETLNSITAAVEDWLAPLPPTIYNQATGLLDGFVDWLGRVVPNLLGGMAGRAGTFAMSIPSFLISLVIFIMAAYFITADYPHLRFMATSRMPGELRRFLGRVKDTAVTAFGGYVKAQLILSFIIFWIILGGFLIIRQPYALLLALILAVLDFIPIIGSGTVMVPWAVIDIFLKDYHHAIELMVIWGIVAVFRRVGEPKVVGDQTGLPPITSLLCIFVGMKLGGVLGMIFAPVVYMVFLNIARGGLFDNTLVDLRLAVQDVAAILRGSAADGQRLTPDDPPGGEWDPATEAPKGEEQDPEGD